MLGVIVSVNFINPSIKKNIPGVFMDNRGMLRASTGKSPQADVWSTALGVYLDILDGESAEKACKTLAQAYRAGTLSYKGNKTIHYRQEQASGDT